MATEPRVIELDHHNTCQICKNALSKYSCPKCSLRYCSLPCYQSREHLDCSEEFYKDCIAEQMGIGSDQESRDKMEDILHRVHADDVDSDDDEVDDIRERMAGVDLDNTDEVWDKLTEDEKQEFMAFVRSEDVSKIVEAWEPWWEQSEVKVVESDKVGNYWDICPPLMEIRDFKTITKKTPADCVRHNLTNVLSAYAFAARYFNGEHGDFGREAATCVMSISMMLSKSDNFDCFDSAVKSVEFAVTQSDWIMADKENLTVMTDDVHRILKGPPALSNLKSNHYILAALSDLHSLLKSAVGAKKVMGPNDKFGVTFPYCQIPAVKIESNNRIKEALRKVDYLVSLCFGLEITRKPCRGTEISIIMRPGPAEISMYHPTILAKWQKAMPYITCIKLYSNLPQSYRDMKGFGAFKGKAKEFLINNAFYTTDEFLDFSG